MLTVAQSLRVAVLQQAGPALESRNLTARRPARARFPDTRTNHIFSFPRIRREFGRDPAPVRRHVLGNSSETLHQGRDERQRAAS